MSTTNFNINGGGFGPDAFSLGEMLTSIKIGGYIATFFKMFENGGKFYSFRVALENLFVTCCILLSYAIGTVVLFAKKTFTPERIAYVKQTTREVAYYASDSVVSWGKKTFTKERIDLFFETVTQTAVNLATLGESLREKKID